MTIELPEAAWYATHIMEWQLVEYCRDPHEGDVILWHWVDQRGRHAAHEIGWDPKVHDADALHLWRQLPNPKHLYVDEDGGVVVYAPKWAGAGSDEREAICRAVYVWWLVQQDGHNTRTGKDTP